MVQECEVNPEEKQPEGKCQKKHAKKEKMRKPKPMKQKDPAGVNARNTESAYTWLLKQGWAWKPHDCTSCSGRLLRQTVNTSKTRGFGRCFYRCEDCKKYFDVLCFSYLMVLRMPLKMVVDVITLQTRPLLPLPMLAVFLGSELHQEDVISHHALIDEFEP